MSHPNVTIRHASQALRLLIAGAVREIEADAGGMVTLIDAQTALIDALAEQLLAWEIPGSRATRLDELLDGMLSMVADERHPLLHRDVVRALLVEHQLLP